MKLVCRGKQRNRVVAIERTWIEARQSFLKMGDRKACLPVAGNGSADGQKAMTQKKDN